MPSGIVLVEADAGARANAGGRRSAKGDGCPPEAGPGEVPGSDDVEAAEPRDANGSPRAGVGVGSANDNLTPGFEDAG